MKLLQKFKGSKKMILLFAVQIYPNLFSHNRRLRTFIHLLAKRTKRQGTAWWVQVGANDGGEWDPVAQSVRFFHLNALLIEPVGYLFMSLKHNYAPHGHHCRLEKLAIGNQTGTVTINGIAADKLKGLPGWAAQISSLRKDVLLKHGGLINGLHDKITQEEVAIQPLSAVLKAHAITQIDYLQIDAEGYDAEVIKSIDFNDVQIRVLSFENKHLKPDENGEVEGLLTHKGFSLLVARGDTLAWQRKDAEMERLVKKYLSS